MVIGTEGESYRMREAKTRGGGQPNAKLDALIVERDWVDGGTTRPDANPLALGGPSVILVRPQLTRASPRLSENGDAVE